MSILIKDMEMPKNCAKCFVGFCKQIGCEHYIGFDDYDRACHPDCLLIPIPEPHGRLGDLDELYASIKKWLIQNRYNMTEATRVWICGVLEGIAAAPTIIPASEASEEGET